MSDKRVSIILPCYVPDAEVLGYLHRCIKQLWRNTPEGLFDLIIVENGSDCTEDFKCLLRIHSEHPLGYARAVNIGIRLAKTEYVCIINNDLFVTSGWLEQMIADYESILDCGVLAPNGPPGITFDSHWWSCVLIRKSVIDTVGLLDEEKLNYRYHDQDWNILCRKAGYAVARTGNVQMDHVNSATYDKMKRDDTPEREEMIRRWGVAHFEEWVALI